MCYVNTSAVSATNIAQQQKKVRQATSRGRDGEGKVSNLWGSGKSRGCRRREIHGNGRVKDTVIITQGSLIEATFRCCRGYNGRRALPHPLRPDPWHRAQTPELCNRKEYSFCLQTPPNGAFWKRNERDYHN